MSSQPAPAPFQEPAQPSPRPVRVPEPPQPGRPRRWRIPALIAVIALGGLLYFALRPDAATKTGGGDVVQPAPVTAGRDVKPRIRLSGQTSARNFAQIMVPTFRGPDSGRDLTLMNAVKPGTFVNKGDIVAEFDAQTLLDHVDDVKDQVQQAENDVKKREAEQLVEWTSLQQSVKVAKADWDKALLDQRAAEVNTEIQREIARLRVEESEAAYKALIKELEDKKRSHAADLMILKITVKRQAIHLNNHVIDLPRFKVRAPMDGLAVMAQTFRGGENRSVQVGDQVFPGMQIMKIVDTRSMQLEALVSQADSDKFRVGQAAQIGVDAFPDLKFNGKIHSIGALATRSGTGESYWVRSVPVKIAIEGNDPRLIPDLSAWAFVDSAQQQLAQR
ncbi:MAG TPA: HlyD family efflux transporter periplasmic adaptor subunit [Bryobacteraceae bacterium]|nr:HlyD family efflux transporter periplasmic adaptor subunit [Bryobacteraceae bacterium]